MSQIGDEQNIQGWRVIRVVTGRGFAKRMGDDAAPLEDVIGLTLYCEDLKGTGDFIFSIDEAEATAHALLDSVRNAREEEV